MPPALTVNHVAVLLCVIAAMPLGFLWFGPLFGKAWLRQMGMEGAPRPDGAAMAKSMLIYAGFDATRLLLFACILSYWR
jgi:hypothetical protein